MEKDDRKYEKIDVVLKDLLENTTIHGLPNISTSKHIVVKLLWFCVFIVASVLLVLQLHGLIKEYNSNPKQTTITLQTGTLKFPAITICNMNVVKLSTVNLQAQLSELANAEDSIRHIEANGVIINAVVTDIYESLLEGYAIPEEYRATFYPQNTYWELVDYLRSIYFQNNPKSQDVDSDAKLIATNELLMLLSEETQTPTQTPAATTTPDPDVDDTVDFVNVNLRKSRDSSFPSFGYFFRDMLDKPEYRQPMDLWKTRITLFEAIVRQQTRYFRFRLGHQFEDLVISSHFAGAQDNLTYKHYWTKDYGNCFTIDSPKYETRHSGSSYGFDLLLNLEMDEYITNVQESQGVRVVLHEQGTVPFSNAEGITLAPGYEHQIGLKLVKTSRLGPPYGICTDGLQFWEKYKTKYTRNICTAICKIELFIEECGCLPEDSTEILDKYVDLPVCTFATNSSVKACVERMKSKLNGEIDICDCIEPCSATAYLKTISGRPWPSDKYLSSVIVDSLCDYEGRILPSMVKMCHEHWEKTLNIQKYRNNFMKIQIYFEDTQHQVIAEESTYGLVRFLSDIGGTAGLFIGASVLSIVEILQVALEIMLYLRKRRQLTPEQNIQDGDRTDVVNSNVGHI